MAINKKRTNQIKLIDAVGKVIKFDGLTNLTLANF